MVSEPLQRVIAPRPKYKPPPETDPDKTATLWEAVRELRSDTMSRLPGNMPLRSASSRLLDSTAASTNDTSKRNAPKVTDENFRSAILDRYNIKLLEPDSKNPLSRPFKHFSTLDPEKAGFEGKIMDWYQLKHSDCHVWLSLDRGEAANQAEQYFNMQSIGENEAKFSHHGKRYFFKEDKIFLPKDHGRCSSTYFKLEWGPTPDNAVLHCPPLLKTSTSDKNNTSLFGFNTNPDCTYWLTLRRMNENYRRQVDWITYVLPGANVTAPYLTIEFKKDHTSVAVTENQVAVSAALILYNRFRLRCRRLEADRLEAEERGLKAEVWNEDKFADIKHYGITFSACVARFYIGRPSLSFETLATGAKLQDSWQGCTLRPLAKYSADDGGEILHIQRWVNEIHNRGLGEHSSEFVLDVQKMLVHMGAVDEEDVSFLPEEFAALPLETDQPSGGSAPE